MFKSFPIQLKWLLSRVAVIYVVFFIFSLLCVDFKMLDMRIKTRHLNDAIPNFSDLILFSKNHDAKKDINLGSYKFYFELILKYIPQDVVTKQLLGYVDYYMGQENQAIDLFKRSAELKGHELFWADYNLGLIYYKKQMWPQSASYLLKAIGANQQLAILLMKNSQVYKQIFLSPYFRYSLDDGLVDAQGHAYVLLLSDFQKMGQYDKMILISNLCLGNQKLGYQDAYYYYAGLAFYQLGQMQKAFLLFQKALTLEKHNPDIYYYLADIYQNIGQLSQAREYLQASYALHLKSDDRFPYDKDLSLRIF